MKVVILITLLFIFAISRVAPFGFFNVQSNTADTINARGTSDTPSGPVSFNARANYSASGTQYLPGFGLTVPTSLFVDDANQRWKYGGPIEYGQYFILSDATYVAAYEAFPGGAYALGFYAGSLTNTTTGVVCSKLRWAYANEVAQWAAAEKLVGNVTIGNKVFDSYIGLLREASTEGTQMSVSLYAKNNRIRRWAFAQNFPNYNPTFLSFGYLDYTSHTNGVPDPSEFELPSPCDQLINLP